MPWSPAEETALRERLLVGFVVVQVALRNVLTADGDLAFLAASDFIAFGVEDLDFDALANSYGSGLALARRERVRGHLVGGFGHGIGFQDWCAKRGLEIVEDFWRERGAARSDEANVGERVRLGRLEQDLVDGGNSRVPVRLVGGELFPEAACAECAGHDY